MKLIVEQTYPWSITEVAAMLTDVSFVRWRAEHVTGTGTVSQAEVDHDDAGGVTIMVRRTLPTDLIPAQVRAIIGDSVEVRQAEVWVAPAGERIDGTAAAEIVGVPIRIHGTVALESLPDGGTRKTYSGEIQATIPLFAQVVEQAVEKTLRRTLAREEAAGREWLARKAN